MIYTLHKATLHFVFIICPFRICLGKNSQRYVLYTMYDNSILWSVCVVYGNRSNWNSVIFVLYIHVTFKFFSRVILFNKYLNRIAVLNFFFHECPVYLSWWRLQQFLLWVELLPLFRSQFMGFTSLKARIGACSAPWVVQWVEHIHHTLSFAILRGAAFIAVIICTQLPETRLKLSPETFNDVVRDWLWLLSTFKGKTSSGKVHKTLPTDE